MTLQEARRYLRQFARNASDESTYDDDEIDRAIQAACDNFILHTKCTRSTGTVAVLADASALGAFPTAFYPEGILRAWITSKGNLTVIPHGELLDKQMAGISEEMAEVYTGLPEFIAFSSLTAGEVYPTPDANYTINLLYWAPLISFTPGMTTPSTVTLNLPDHYLREILIYGACAILQHNEVESQYASVSWRKYEEFRDSRLGGNNLGQQSGSYLGADF